MVYLAWILALEIPAGSSKIIKIVLTNKHCDQTTSTSEEKWQKKEKENNNVCLIIDERHSGVKIHGEECSQIGILFYTEYNDFGRKRWSRKYTKRLRSPSHRNHLIALLARWSTEPLRTWTLYHGNNPTKLGCPSCCPIIMWRRPQWNN